MIEKKQRKFEYIVLTCVLFLCIFGLIVLYSASSVSANRIYGNATYLFLRQSIFCITGLVLALFFSFIPFDIYIKFSKYIYIFCLSLVLVTAFAGRISRGSSRWITLNGIIFQPSELMKLAMILYLPKIFAEIKCDLDKKENFLRVLFVSYVPTMIVSLNNLSTGIILFLIATFMIFIVSKKKLIFLFIFTMIIVAYLFALPIAEGLTNSGLLKQYQAGRIFAWKKPEEYPDIAYQTLQGLYAIGSGRISGRGYLSSIQKPLLPEAQNDMIFAILCEELGMIGATIFLILYLVMILRIFFISLKQSKMTAKLLTCGIGVHIALQVILNIGVVTNLLPNTGITLPFVSYGGTSLIVLFVEIGIVMSALRYED